MKIVTNGINNQLISPEGANPGDIFVLRANTTGDLYFNIVTPNGKHDFKSLKGVNFFKTPKETLTKALEYVTGKLNKPVYAFGEPGEALNIAVTSPGTIKTKLQD